MNASRSSASETRQSFSSGWIGMVKKPRFIKTLHGHSGAPRSGEPGIHNHDPHDKRNDVQTMKAGVYGFRACAFGTPRNDSGPFSHHAISRHSPLRSAESNTASSAAT